MKKVIFDKTEIISFIKERYIYILAYLYLFSSVFIFLIGNVKYAISIPLSILLLIALIKAILNAPKMKVNLFANKKKAIIIMSVIVIWVIFSGIGGFIWQNRGDHKFRNALFEDLVVNKWPVIQEGKALCYYLGFWLPAAITGKIFGLTIGYTFQVFWAVFGISIAFGIICQYLKNVKIRNIIIFILYSGVDIFVYLLYYKILKSSSIREGILTVINGVQMENTIGLFRSSSNTTLLFWVYNQIIPFWVGMMLLLQQKNSKSIIFIYALMLLYSPFPLVAIAPVIMYLIFKKQENEKNDKEGFVYKAFNRLKNACTYENIVSLFIIVIVGLFFKSNIAAGKIGIVEIKITVLLRYVLYLISEYIVFLIFIYKRNKHDWIFNILLITTFVIPFIKLGDSNDFQMRTCIPLAFYIMLLVMKYFEETDVSKKAKVALIVILCFGAISPMTEFIRTIKGEINVIRGIESARSNGLTTIFTKENNECYDNFIANTNSIFYRYLSK